MINYPDSFYTKQVKPLKKSTIEPNPDTTSAKPGPVLYIRIKRVREHYILMAADTMIAEEEVNYFIKEGLPHGKTLSGIQWHRAKLRESDLMKWSKRLRTMIQVIPNPQHKSDFTYLTSKLINYVHEGVALYHRIFPKDSEIDGKLRYLLEKFEEGPRHVIVCAESFFLPWEFLYFPHVFGEVQEQLSSDSVTFEDFQSILSGFFGMSFVVSRMQVDPIEHLGEDMPANPESLVLWNRTYGFRKNRHSPIRRIQLPTLRKYSSSVQEFGIPLKGKHTRSSLVQHFNKFIRQNSYELLHMATHIEENQDSYRVYFGNKLITESGKIAILSDSFYLELPRDFFIHPDDLEFSARNPYLLVANSCTTGVYDPSSDSSLVTIAWKSDAKNVLATDGPVGIRFSSLFIRELYKSLFSDEMTIGDTLYSIRQKYLFTRCRNPERKKADLLRAFASLVYALYGNPEFRVKESNVDGDI